MICAQAAFLCAQEVCDLQLKHVIWLTNIKLYHEPPGTAEFVINEAKNEKGTGVPQRSQAT